MQRALVLTLDGGGDGRSGSVWRGVDGRLERLSSVDSFNSLGNFYSYITMLCGFRAERHEGKVTGLAACGRPRYADILRSFVRYQEPGQIRYSIPMYHTSALRQIAARLPRDFDRADLAASVQLVLEEVGLAFASYWLERSGERNLAVAGGVFGNVKLNQRIHELPAVDKIFVHPAMDDSGLAVGSALASWAARCRVGGDELCGRLADAYLGPDFSDAEIESALQGQDAPVERHPRIHETIARMLAQGHVVARFHGRLEYGPRALGHRSILYQTTDPSVNDWLNQCLDRTEFMPFGPATLVEHAAGCYRGLNGAEDPARFMTITFDCSEKMKSESPGVVHMDGTARPQLVDRETSPDFHAILRAYHHITGIPSLINTSFNMHEEPIVCDPEDAVRAFREGGLDYLAIGDWLVANPAARTHRRSEQVSLGARIANDPDARNRWT
jgi:carbamoyltransferase